MGIVLMALLRGGWRNWRGLLTFAAVATVVGAPWYLNHLSEFSTFVRISTANPQQIPGDSPPTLSFTNLTWYFWNILNSQLLLGLFMFLLGGATWMLVTLLRRRRRVWGARLGASSSTMRPDAGSAAASADDRVLGAWLELLVGAFVAWFFITLTPSHDLRYGIPLLPYLAVIATGWIPHLPRPARRAATAVVVLVVLANNLGVTFGVGRDLRVALANPLPVGEQAADQIAFYTNSGFLASAPSRDGDVPGLLSALRRDGVNTVAWNIEESREPDFSFEGLLPLARISRLSPAVTNGREFSHSPTVATLIHQPISSQAPSPCTKLSDGTGVWVVRYNTSTGSPGFYCPSRHPHFYK
jgi:hypothetical protein